MPILPCDVEGTRSAPVDRRDAFVNSARIWLGCVAFLAVVNLYITFVGGGLEKDPRIGLFSWPSIAIFGVAGAVGVWLSHRTGFPAAWDPRISNRGRPSTHPRAYRGRRSSRMTCCFTDRRVPGEPRAAPFNALARAGPLLF